MREKYSVATKPWNAICITGNYDNGTVHILMTYLDDEIADGLDLKEMKHIVAEYCFSCT